MNLLKEKLETSDTDDEDTDDEQNEPDLTGVGDTVTMPLCETPAESCVRVVLQDGVPAA